MRRAWAWFLNKFALPALLGRGLHAPYWHLEGYMLRFWIAGGSSRDERRDAVLGWKRTRSPVLLWLGHRLAIRLHCILRPDKDPDKHDHPWPFASLILCGGYTEDTLKGPRRYGPGSWNLKRAADFHRITALVEPTWTLVFMWKKRGESWGYLVGGRKVPWRQYQKEDAT